MRTNVVWREAWAGAAAAPGRSVLSILAVALIGASTWLWDFTSTTNLLAEAEQFRASGAATSVLNSASAVDRDGCEGLVGHAGVEAAGAFSARTERSLVSTLPDAPLALFDATPGVLAVLGASVSERATSGIAISTEVAEATGAELGDSIFLDGVPVQVIAVYAYPSDGRLPLFGWSALRIGADGSQRFDSCIASAWPANGTLSRALVRAVAPSAAVEASPPSMAQLNPRFGVEFAGAQRYAERLSRLAPLAAVLLATGLSFAATRSRRLEIGAELHLGAKRADVVAVRAITAGLIGGAGAVFVSAIGLSLSWTVVGGADAHAVGATAFATALAIFVGNVMGSVAGVMSIRRSTFYADFKRR
jgi:hypothetical protein